MIGCPPPPLNWLERTLSGHTSDVLGIAYAPDGKSIATASRDNTAKIWDVQTGKVLQTLSGHTSDVLGIAYAPDGKSIATASSDKTIHIWWVSANAIVEAAQAIQIAYFLPYQVQEYQLAEALENGLGIDHFTKKAPARQLYFFGIYYQETTENNNNSDFVPDQLDKAEQCYRAAAQKDAYYEQFLVEFLAYKAEKLEDLK